MFTSGIFRVILSDALQGNTLLPLQGSQVAQLHSSFPGAHGDSVAGGWRLRLGGCLTTWGLKLWILLSKDSAPACHSILPRGTVGPYTH